MRVRGGVRGGVRGEVIHIHLFLTRFVLFWGGEGMGRIEEWDGEEREQDGELKSKYPFQAIYINW